MKIYFTAAALFTAAILHADPSDEALFVRRITEFHKDREASLVKAQINEFLKLYPHSSFRDSLMVMLGDTYWSEQEYGKARTAYESIGSAKLRESVRDNYIDTLYRLGDYTSAVAAVIAIAEDNRLPLHRLYLADAQRQLAKQDSLYLPDAIRSYEELLESEHASEAKTALAELHAQSRNFPTALSYYLELIDLHPERRGEFTLKAARLKGADDPQGVIDMLTDNSSPEAQFLVGRSHFALHNYKEAYNALAPLAPNAQANEPAVLCMLVVSAFHLGAHDQVAAWADQFEFSYPDDNAMAYIWHIRGLTHAKAGELEAARRYFEKAVNEEKPFDQRDAALYELAIVLFKMNEFIESRNRFLDLLAEYPDSSFRSDALKYVPQNTMHLLSTSVDDRLKAQLADDLTLLLDAGDAISPDERPKYLLKRSKALYDLSNFQEAEDSLYAYVKDYPNDPNLYQAHLLLAMCSRQNGEDPTRFIGHAEASLALNPSQPDRSRLQLNLFSSYLSLANKENNPLLFDKAADHLYEIIQNGSEDIKRENQLWLANHLYNKVKDPSREYMADPLVNPEKVAEARKAAAIFEIALKDNLQSGINRDSLFLEFEIYKLGNLYGWLDQPHEQETILKQLAEQQEDHPSWAWSLRTRTQFAIAYALYRQELHNQAFRIVEALNAQKGLDPHIAGAAKLLQARLSYLVLSDEERALDNPRVVAILQTLKDLQIRKSLSSEPIHLEAALDYAAFRSSLEAPEKQLENRRFLLQRAKDSFTCKDDICSKDYQASRAKLPEKEKIYQAYMMLIDAHIAAAESEISHIKEDREDAALRAEAARSMYQNLLKEKFAVSKYLIDQAQSGLHSVASENFYEKHDL